MEKQREIDRLREEVHRLKRSSLSGKPLSDEHYYGQAEQQIEDVMKVEAKHPGIRTIQGLFVEKAERMHQIDEADNQSSSECRGRAVALVRTVS